MVDCFMAAAIAEARAGVRAGHGGPFGAVMVQGGVIVARAHNRVVVDRDPTAHAEMMAIRATARALDRFELADCTLYSTCEPCPMCLAAIHWARLSRLYYGANREDAAAIGFDDRKLYELFAGERLPELAIIATDREACLAPFREWQARVERVRY